MRLLPVHLRHVQITLFQKRRPRQLAVIGRVAIGAEGNQHVWQPGAQVAHVSTRRRLFARSLVLAFGINAVAVKVERPRTVDRHACFAGRIVALYVVPAPCLHAAIVQRSHHRRHNIPVLAVKAKRVARICNFEQHMRKPGSHRLGSDRLRVASLAICHPPNKKSLSSKCHIESV